MAVWLGNGVGNINEVALRWARLVLGWVTVGVQLPVTAINLIDRSDYELLTKICFASHSLYHLLPPDRTSDLRLRGHPFQLPDYHTDLHKKSFIVRSLHEYIK